MHPAVMMVTSLAAALAMELVALVAIKVAEIIL